MVYGAGTIVLTYIESHYNPTLPLNYTPAIISIGIGFFGFFNPKDWLNRSVNFMMDKIMKKDDNNGKADMTAASSIGIIEKHGKRWV